MKIRGIRNNNPGNIKRNSDKWQGLADQQNDPEFFAFKSPEWGIRAMARILIKYQDDDSVKNLSQLIAKWAPATENNTDSYVRAVANETKIGLNEPINLHDYTYMQPIIKAMIHEESGVSNPYPDTTIDRGLTLAGIEPPKKPILQSNTLRGTVIAASGTIINKTLELSDPIQQVKDELYDYTTFPFIRDICVTLTIIGLIIVVIAYIKDRKERLT